MVKNLQKRPHQKLQSVTNVLLLKHQFQIHVKVANLYSQVVKILQKRPHQKLQSVTNVVLLKHQFQINVVNLYCQVVKNLQKRPHQKLQSVFMETLPRQKDLLLKHIQNYLILKQNVTQTSQTIVFNHHQHQHLFPMNPH